MENHELTAVVETLLFVSGDPVPVERLAQAIDGVKPDRIREALEALRNNYEAPGRGLQIVEVAGGFQITTRQECASWIRTMEEIKAATRLSKSALETLAITSYKQPITRGEIELIRGVDSAGVLRKLMDRRILKIVGRREGVGRPILYGTTQEFLKFFGLKDLSELPTLRELKEIAEETNGISPETSGRGEEPLAEEVAAGSGEGDTLSENEKPHPS